MYRKPFAPYTLVFLCLLTSTDTSQVVAANMRSFVEAVRRKAAVVYVGSVKEVQLLTRTKFDIKARPLVDVLAVVRSPGTNPREATLEYSSFDEKTPMLEGGPQYQLKPGVQVVIFANSFASSIPPGYLLQGSGEELLQRVTALRDTLSPMSPDQLKVNEINEEDRRIQLGLYEKLAAYIQIMNFIAEKVDTSLPAFSDRPNRGEEEIFYARPMPLKRTPNQRTDILA
jgi:hypothetical protein